MATKIPLVLAVLLLPTGAWAHWHGVQEGTHGSELVGRSRDASLAFIASLDQDHSRAEVLLLDAGRAQLLSAARWRAAGTLAWAAGLVALLACWITRSIQLGRSTARAIG